MNIPFLFRDGFSYLRTSVIVDWPLNDKWIVHKKTGRQIGNRLTFYYKLFIDQYLLLPGSHQTSSHQPF